MKMTNKKICFGYCGSTGNEEFVSNDYLQVNNCGLLLFDDYASESSPPRTRLDYMLVYVSEGTGNIYIDNIPNRLHAGDLIYYPPNTSINFEFHPHSSHYWIHFTGSAVEQLIQSTGIKYNFINKIGVINNINLLFSEIAFSISKQSEIEKLSINSNFLKLFYIFAQQLDSKNPITISNENHPVAFAKNIMLTEFWKDHDSNYYAKKCGCSVSTFNHTFQNLYHTTPKKFITLLRIEHAKRLLITTNLSIKEISLSSGYPDPLYFCKVFKSHSHISPSEYRSKHQK